MQANKNGIASDPLEWQGFWDRFQASIHNNDSLADIDGFNYLKDNLKGEALAAISGLSLSSENYKQAVAILKNRYGNEQVLISAHMESMLRIKKIKSKENVRGLRTLYNHIENCVRNLKSFKIDSASYGSPLIPILNISRDCTAKYVCTKCKSGRHHISICDFEERAKQEQEDKKEECSCARKNSNENRRSCCLYIVMIKLGYCVILPQTARANISDVDNCLQVHTRILFDSGSQGPTSLKQFEIS